MARKRSMQMSLSQWAYQNRKMKAKTAEILHSVGEVEKALEEIKAGGKKKK